jgi:GTP cyclohydrolase II
VQHFLTPQGEGLVASSTRPFAVPTPVRIQSSCLFGQAFKSLDCDCGLQLWSALEIVVQQQGLLVYVLEEGRGAGLRLKVAAMHLQQALGLDTAEAYGQLGLQPDLRDHTSAVAVVRHILGTAPLELITNNPNKMDALRDEGLQIVRRRSLVLADTDAIREYLREKQRVLGHHVDG